MCRCVHVPLRCVQVLMGSTHAEITCARSTPHTRHTPSHRVTPSHTASHRATPRHVPYHLPHPPLIGPSPPLTPLTTHRLRINDEIDVLARRTVTHRRAVRAHQPLGITVLHLEAAVPVARRVDGLIVRHAAVCSLLEGDDHLPEVRSQTLNLTLTLTLTLSLTLTLTLTLTLNPCPDPDPYQGVARGAFGCGPRGGHRWGLA